MHYFWFEKAQKFYEIGVAKNLLGDWQLSRRYGRRGTRGRIKHEIISDENCIDARLKTLVRYRMKTRGYRLVHQCSS